MKHFILIILILLFVCCVPEKNEPSEVAVRVCIVETYLEDSSANDGVIEKDWMTVFSVETNGSRQLMRGKWGTPGDCFNMRITEYGLCSFY